ncbi:MAG: ATP-binding cassette domain-containing protein, partial [Pseudomonadota bacterium]|nr:ATP-binding cassette domain-containing protein [Pseudomonadota bacterium]
YLPLRIAGVSRARARGDVEDALALVGLTKFAEVYPRELSGGMKMRVSIARAMVTQPRLLLMDEPFAALDEMTRAKLNDDVLRLWKERDLTIVFVTHNVWEAVYLSSRVVVMAARPGRVVDDIRIDAPYPRSDAFRTTPAYADHCVHVSRSLRETLGPADVDR